MSELLTDDEVNAELAGLAGWNRDGDAIARTAELPSFPAAIAVVDRVAAIAEARDHHPDIDIRWRTLTFRCSTHSAGGLTAKDIALAHEINAVLAAPAEG
jgi:4a-hydroxytetrahydrobiopterin dehydratase